MTNLFYPMDDKSDKSLNQQTEYFAGKCILLEMKRKKETENAVGV